jgi:hypothetical protein
MMVWTAIVAISAVLLLGLTGLAILVIYLGFGEHVITVISLAVVLIIVSLIICLSIWASKNVANQSPKKNIVAFFIIIGCLFDIITAVLGSLLMLNPDLDILNPHLGSSQIASLIGSVVGGWIVWFPCWSDI